MPGIASPSQPIDRRLSVAPMMDHTDRHQRYLLRLITAQTVLYTEMIVTGALLRGERSRLLAFDPLEHPLALQLGGSDPRDMAVCARLAESAGFDEVNINVGCPSSRVQRGRFGACLMAEPDLVAACVSAMRAAVSLPVTVKTRIGIDDADAYEDLARFVTTVAATGCTTFIVHARKAWLSGLSPKDNRTIPPLHYDRVHRLKSDFPHLEIIINGGITSLQAVGEQLALVDGVMIGREAYHNPYLLATADADVYGCPSRVRSRADVVEQVAPYVERELAAGTRLTNMTRHLLGLFQGQPGARRWRRHLSEHAHRKDASVEVLFDALAKLGSDDSSR